MNPGMPSSGMPSGASSGAPYFNGWSPSGGFSQPQQNYGGYGFSSPYGGMNGGFGSPYGGFGSPFGSPYGGFGGFGGGYSQPFQQMPMGGGKGGYSSPFSQFQTPNFAAKGGGTQLQSPPSPAPPPFAMASEDGHAMPGNQPQQPATGLPQLPLTGSVGTAPPTTGIVGAPQPIPPVPQAVPPQMMNPVSGPAQMGPEMQPTGILPQQTFNQNRLPGANPIFPKRNMLIGGYR